MGKDKRSKGKRSKKVDVAGGRDDGLYRFDPIWSSDMGGPTSSMVSTPYVPTASLGDHGSRWASQRELEQAVAKASMSGLKGLNSAGVVLWSDGKDMMMDTSDTHSMIIGSTGSQKSRRTIMPTIYGLARAGENMIVADCKGELFDMVGGFLQARGYRILNINMRDPLHSHAWNPLLIPYRMFWSDDPAEKTKGEMMIYDLCSVMCPLKNFTDPYWELSGQDVLAGSIQLLFRCCKDESRINMRSVLGIIEGISRGSEEILDYIGALDNDDPISICISGTAFNAENTKRCIISMARRATRVFTSQDAIARQLSYNDIDMNMFEGEKVALFITVPDERRAFHGVVSLFVKQSYEYFISMADRNPQHRLEHRMNYVIDEFASFPSIDSFDSMMSASRSRNIRINMVIQGMDQLRSRYGSEIANTILGNCGNIIFLNSREQDLLRYISDLVGVDANGRPLINTSDLQRLDKPSGQALVLHDREYPFLSNLVDISEYGLPDTTPLDFEDQSSRTIPVFDFTQYMDEIKRELRRSEIEEANRLCVTIGDTEDDLPWFIDDDYDEDD